MEAVRRDSAGSTETAKLVCDVWTRAGLPLSSISKLTSPSNHLTGSRSGQLIDRVRKTHLATRWSASEDTCVWRFDLREGVKFHDRTLVDAEAAAVALRRLVPRSQYAVTAGITAVEADGRTLVVKTTAPFSLLPAYLCDRTVPTLARASFDE